MQTHLAPDTIPYTGRELCSHWILRTFGLPGDAIVAFVGPAELGAETMVDLADVAAGDVIRARAMLHFIVERFDNDLERAVVHQRLLVALAAELLRELTTTVGREGPTRRGDDLYVGTRKLSVSIATISPVSTLIHLGVNIDPEGAPVAAIGLAELGVEPTAWALRLMAAYVGEVAGIRQARCKVRAVP